MFTFILWGKGQFYTINEHFPAAIMHFVKEGRVPDHVKYFLFMDAFDTVLLGDASKIDQAFESYDADIVTIGTKENFPVSTELR